MACATVRSSCLPAGLPVQGIIIAALHGGVCGVNVFAAASEANSSGAASWSCCARCPRGSSSSVGETGSQPPQHHHY